MHEIKIPDSVFCRAASEYARRVCAPFLFHHSVRSFLFADVLGQLRGVTFDRELLFLSTVLHDLGLTDEAPAATRFEVEGADLAREFLARLGAGEREQELVWDAIALHTTMVIPQRKCPEIALCQFGTALDIGFAPLDLLPDGFVRDVLAQYPRQMFKGQMIEALCGRLRKDRNAATSQPVADVGERLLPGFSRLHTFDVIMNAGFSE